ncbi:2Fe-2S iron-sulfur cluster-binding protein [Thauera sp. WH-1]|uniref:2Fe-2S iron-sulfur cluster-binding protein n=1 Tax=Thauera sp. WH-1 TaxID=3398230 RepID=UPI0039FD1CE1
MNSTFMLDGEEVPFTPGQTVMQAAAAAGKYIPHLCWHPDFAAHGSCKLCTVKIGGRFATACTVRAAAGQEVDNHTPELTHKRRTLLQLLFVEGNHFCPSCEKSGDCALQATAYEMGMLTPHFDHFFPDRPVDASHPDVLLEFNRCIMCELCVRASREVDGKDVFALSGRGTGSHLIVNSESGRLADTDFAATDRAAAVCPVGVILKKRVGFAIPIGKRTYDIAPISAQPAGDPDTGNKLEETP